MNKYASFFLTFFAISCANQTNVQAQRTDLNNISDKLDRLERDIQALSRNFYKNTPTNDTQTQKSHQEKRPSGVGNAYIIRLEDRLAEMKVELQNSTNKIESISYSLDGIKGRVDKLVSDIDFRLTRLESKTDKKFGGPSNNSPPNISGVPLAAGVNQIGESTGGPIISSGKPSILGKISEESLSDVSSRANKSDKNHVIANVATPKRGVRKQYILPGGVPEEQYRFALSILRKTEYSRAEQAFNEFIQRNPKNKLTPNARYWLGESFYVRKNYRSAAEAFLRGYQQAPKGLKAPSSLLKLGMSLANLKKNQDACATFTKLAKDYPDASENIKKHLKREFQRSRCK